MAELQWMGGWRVAIGRLRVVVWSYGLGEKRGDNKLIGGRIAGPAAATVPGDQRVNGRVNADGVATGNDRATSGGLVIWTRRSTTRWLGGDGANRSSETERERGIAGDGAWPEEEEEVAVNGKKATPTSGWRAGGRPRVAHAQGRKEREN
ncbi:hypothetical protein NL676_018127 [Syzygium grande]|nr:hypothetical protein NL676_018127 [Syzygium grande]